jgi:hypothetical protein
MRHIAGVMPTILAFLVVLVIFIGLPMLAEFLGAIWTGPMP